MATAKEAGELKIQGVVEAARDPSSSVTAEDVQKKMLEESKKAGVPAFNFDPNASVEQKRAQTRAAIPAGITNPKRVKGVAIATDIDDGSKPAYDLPEPSKDGVVEVPKGKDGKPNVQDAEEEKARIAALTGWAPRFGGPKGSVLEGDSLLDHSTWLEGQIPEKFYGDWYYNAGIIIFACISSWLVAVLGGGLAWVFIIMAVCATYYRTSIRRVRRNFRDDLNRELALKRLETDTESLEWINSFLVKFWPIVQPIIADTVVASVDQVLSSATPAFLDSLKLSFFSLGTKPPRMEHVKTHPRTEDDILIMDWKFSFTPNDTSDMTARQIASKVNPKVILEIRVGKAMISKGIPVIVEDMAFSGLLRVKLKLQIPFPHVEKVEISFLERPSIDYVCKPLGGDTFGFDINFIPGLESFILEQIHGNLAPLMYDPNVFPIEVAKMLSGSPVDQAVGVVAITLHGAQGLKNPDNFAGTTDPYAIVTLNKRQPLAQTKVIKDTSNPRWNETHYVIITSFNDTLDVQVFDFNDFRKDKELGVASFLLEDVEEINEYENESLEIISDGKARGVLSCDIRFFPVLKEQKLLDGRIEPPPPSNTGILRFTVEQAKDLDGTKSLVGLLNPYAALLLNGREVHATAKKKRTNNPVWDNGSKEILITDKKAARLGVVIKDDRDIAGDQIIGNYQIKLDEMLECMAKGQEWYILAGVKTGRVKMQAQFKPVAISGVVAGTGGYQTPIGVMRFHFKKASGLRNFETVGKSDPYTRVLLSGIERARTVMFKNNLNPEWDEVLYVPVHSPRERLQLEVMDAEKMGRDRSLGLVEIFAGDYVKQDEETGEYMVDDKKTWQEQGLKLHGKGMPKGTITFTAAFYPCINVADPEDEDEGEEGEGRRSVDATQSTEPGKLSAAVEKKDGEATDTPAEKEPNTPTTPKTPMSPRKSRDEKTPPVVRLTPQELLKYESGLVIFKLMEAELPKSDTQVEVWVDDMAFPSYTSSTARTRTFKFDEIGDCFIRELDFSKLTVRVREKGGKDDSKEDKTLARLTGNTLDTLKQCLNNPTTLKMKGEDGRVSSVKISLKYIPVKMELDPSESINNMGNLRVDVLDAADLPSADSNGKSDPYVKFELNGQEMFKTKVQKKTLNPQWNEFFELSVPSRTGAKFKATVYDYDFADKPDYLGAANIPLDQLEAFKAREVKLALDGKSGTLRLRLVFRPDYITRMRQGTSTFSGTFAAPGRIVTGVAGAPIKGGVAVAGVVGHGVGKGASFLKRGFKGKKDDDVNGMTPTGSSVDLSAGGSPANGGGGGPLPALTLRRSTGLTGGSDSEPASDMPPGPANGGVALHERTRSSGAASIHSLMPGAPGAGTASFTVVSAHGFPPSSDVYVVINQQGSAKSRLVGKTKNHKSSTGKVKFDETFKTTCTADTQFQIQVKGQHTFSSDDDLGETLYFVDDSSGAGAGAEKDLKIGAGNVVLRSTFVPSEPKDNNGGGAADSPKSALRRSFLSKRDSRGPSTSREGTPA